MNTDESARTVVRLFLIGVHLCSSVAQLFFLNLPIRELDASAAVYRLCARRRASMSSCNWRCRAARARRGCAVGGCSIRIPHVTPSACAHTGRIWPARRPGISGRPRTDFRDKIAEMGARRLLESWKIRFRTSCAYPTVKPSPWIRLPRVADRIFERHVEKLTVQRFRTHLPLYTLRAAAGKFGEEKRWTTKKTGCACPRACA